MTANRFLCQSEVLILLATKKRSADAVERRVSARRGGRVKKRPLRVRRSDEQTLAVGQLSYFPHATIKAAPQRRNAVARSFIGLLRLCTALCRKRRCLSIRADGDDAAGA
jgi:hypothetical protein